MSTFIDGIFNFFFVRRAVPEGAEGIVVLYVGEELVNFVGKLIGQTQELNIKSRFIKNLKQITDYCEVYNMQFYIPKFVILVDFKDKERLHLAGLLIQHMHKLSLSKGRELKIICIGVETEEEKESFKETIGWKFLGYWAPLSFTVGPEDAAVAQASECLRPA